MKLILLEDVKSLGRAGDVVEASEGYARNFLFPQHLAVEASEEALKEREQSEKAKAKQDKKEEKAEKALAAKIDGAEVVIQAKADEGKLYASVSVKDVAAALKEQGMKVSEKFINFKSTKELGTYEATVDFPSGFDATVNIIIEAK
ncbi:MAG: 50S ribosomal protein L9 [Patescibacteria group bacterium]